MTRIQPIGFVIVSRLWWDFIDPDRTLMPRKGTSTVVARTMPFLGPAKDML